MSGSWWKCAIFIFAVFPLNATALVPGPDQPPVGRSLFDHLFTEAQNGEAVYAIPFPFSRLVERIEQELPEASASGGGGIRQVLIPMGRSLVRDASRNDFFTNPRLVLAVDAHPRFNPKHAGLLLKDRLYIGYMESTALLEVISYNEAAGRFEFQLVENYGPSTQPKVRYANRQLCIACHQNAAPIFSRQQWDETNANPAIDALLNQHNAARYGIPEGEGVGIPFAIDSATNRANYYSYYQLMWQQACEPVSGNSDTTDQTAVSCRAALLRAVLQYLLSDGAGFDQDAPVYQEHFRRIVRAIAAQRWPDGLKIPSSDIPNRNPLLRHGANKVVGTSTIQPSVNVISEAFDPLVLRPPLRWLAPGSDTALQRLVNGLAEFIGEPDRQRLDQYLFDTAIEKRLIDEQKLHCKVQEKNWTGKGKRFAFDCHSIADSGLVESLEGRFTLEENIISQATINSLSMANGNELRNLAMRQNVDEATTGFSRFSLHNNKLHVRLPDGNALGDFELGWQATTAASKTVPARLSIFTDFTLIDEALRRLQQQAVEKKTDALSGLPFRRASIMPAMFRQLGMGKLDWCCINTVAMPAVAVEARKYPQIAELKPFYQYCAACHASTSTFPANFLHGDEVQVKHKIAHCAERIYYRLSMAQEKPGNRSKTPMPPPQTLSGMGQGNDSWTDSDAFKALNDHVSKVLQQGEGMPDIKTYERRGFNQLRSCLPSLLQ